jgi:sterol desaturase/sphingolipid hydroxylase (fatty acid hydroxylase superfamily)
MMKRFLFGLALYAVFFVPSMVVASVMGWRLAPMIALVLASIAMVVAERLGYVKTPSELHKPTTLFGSHDDKR